MKLSQLRELKSFCSNLHSQPDWREVLENIGTQQDDFTINDVRFIHDQAIREVLEDELANDEYCLGCFNANAIAEATGWPELLIKAAQDGEQYEAIGKAMTGEHVANLAQIYVDADGYGHHFNSYDFSEEFITVNGQSYYVFDNH
jgi:hypothetical protein